MEIRTHLNKPHPEKPGYLVLDRVLTNEEVAAQINETLRSIQVDYEGEQVSAFSLSESVFYNKFSYPLNSAFPYPYGDVIVSAGYGRCEGQIIQLLIRDPSTNAYHLFASVKYFIGIEEVSKIAVKLTDAFQAGLFN